MGSKLGSHNAQAKPDEKMNTRRDRLRRSTKKWERVVAWNTVARQTCQRVANKKRRQHDRLVTREDE